MAVSVGLPSFSKRGTERLPRMQAEKGIVLMKVTFYKTY
jgi:hypothetical protein